MVFLSKPFYLICGKQSVKTSSISMYWSSKYNANEVMNVGYISLYDKNGALLTIA